MERVGERQGEIHLKTLVVRSNRESLRHNNPWKDVTQMKVRSPPKFVVNFHTVTITVICILDPQ